MPTYVKKALHTFQKPTPWRDQYATHQWTCPNYGATKQLENTLDISPPIPEEQKRRIQQILGNLLYYDPAVECTILQSLN